MQNKTPLKRTLNLPQMVLYGLGTTIGAGIYALVGELAGISGYLAPFAFLLAALLAGMTALSFAELSSRYPKAAGAALYTQKGLNAYQLSRVVGLLVVLAGIISAAALINAFSGYLNEFIQLDRESTIVLVSLVLLALAIYGIAESVFAAALVTVIGVGGLIWLVWIGQDAWAQLSALQNQLIPSLALLDFGLIFSGALLAFYAFIGFEDMVVVAEEVKDVKRTLPKAIMLTLLITTILYMAIMFTAVLSVEPAELAKSQAPMALLYTTHTGKEATVITLIGMFAIINGALIQLIMASRVLYGLSSRQQLPAIIAYVHPVTQTPIIASIMAGIGIMLFAVFGQLSSLAELTSILMMIVFSLVNLSLWMIKQREHQPPVDAIVFPKWISISAFLITSGFVIANLWHYLF